MAIFHSYVKLPEGITHLFNLFRSILPARAREEDAKNSKTSMRLIALAVVVITTTLAMGSVLNWFDCDNTGILKIPFIVEGPSATLELQSNMTG